jgi:voltage-gated potassium channel
LRVPKEIESVDGTARAVYYTLVTLTTLGYGDITPATQGGMIAAGVEALLGLVWFGMLTSIIVKKVFR